MATLVAIFIALTLLCVAGDGAEKGFGVRDLVAGPVADQEDFNKQGHWATWKAGFRLTGSERAEHVDVAFRPGVTAMLDGLPIDGTQVVGDSTVQAIAGVGWATKTISEHGDIRLIAPKEGETARVAIKYLPTLVVEAGIHIRSSDAQMTAEFDIPSSLLGVPFRVRAVEFRLSGFIRVAGELRPFTKNPDDRKPSGSDWHLTRVTARSAQGTIATASSSFVPEEGDVPLEHPSLRFPGGAMRAGQPSPLSMEIDIPLGDPMATIKTVEVALPQGLAMNATVADGVEGTGLESCSDQQAGIGNNDPPACSPRTVIAAASAITPTVGLLSGSVNLATPPEGWTPTQPFRLFELVAVQGRGYGEIKVLGEVGPDPARHGALITRFDDLPKVPISRLRLDLAGGPHAPFLAPDTPGVYAAELRLTTWANPDGAPVTAQGHFTVIDSPRLPFAPELEVALGGGLSSTGVSPVAGRRTDATFVVTRRDGEPELTGFTLSLPPGLMASLASCTTATVDTGGCPTVGSVSAEVGRGPAPIRRNGKVALAPPGAAVGGLTGGVRVDVGGYDLGVVPVQATFTLPPGELAAKVHVSLPQEIWPGLPLSYRRIEITLEGLTWQSTSCAGKEIRAEFHSAAGAHTQSVRYVPHGCPVPFNPELNVAFDGPVKASQPVGVTFDLTLPRASDTQLGGAVRSTEFLLPAGMSISPGVVNAGAALGSVEADTLEIGPLEGEVRLATSPPGAGPLRAVIMLRSRERPVSLILQVSVIPDASGRVRMVVDPIPEAALTRLRVRIFGGPTGAFVAPPCGDHEVAARLTSWSGGAVRELRARLHVPAPCAGGAFNPGASVNFGTSRPPAARNSPFGMTIARPDGDADMAAIESRLPAGFVTRLGAVPVGGRLAGIRVVVGTGPSTVQLSGNVILSQPLANGRATLTGVVQAKVGPIDRGLATVPITVELDRDLRVVVRATLPQVVGGIPLHYRLIELSLDRALVRHSSSCALQQIEVMVTSKDGRRADRKLDYEPTGCSTPALYEPRLAGSIQGNTGLLGHPALTMSITQGDWQAATREMIIDLPPLSQLLPNPAAAGRVVGDATVLSPAISGPLVGSVRLLAEAGQLTLEVAFRGQVNLTLRGLLTISPTGRIRVVLGGAPDLPFTSLTVRLYGGPNGPLIAPLPLCGQRPTLEGDLKSHSGHSIRQVAALAVTGC